MAHQSLQFVDEEQQVAKRYVARCLKSSKRNKVFCLVEGELDYKIYSARLNPKHIEVVIAEDKRKNAGYRNVIKFVSELRMEYPKARVIGIRDKDYSILLGQKTPDGICHTDYRDIEMTIFSSASFLASDTTLTEKTSLVMPYCRHLAYLRIFNESKGMICRMKDKVKISFVYCIDNRSFHIDWQSRLNNAFISNSEPACIQNEIDTFIVSHDLDKYRDYDVCRGHDIISLMGILYGVHYHKNEMEDTMCAHYSKEDFYSTRLFANIQKYCDDFGIDAQVS